jgi:hypothetical protein
MQENSSLLSDNIPEMFHAYEHHEDSRFKSTLVVAIGVILIFLLNASTKFLNPLEIGLLSNDITSFVGTDTTYGPGLHLIGPGRSFVIFPSTQISMVFTDTPAKGAVADAGPILTRTGEDHDEPDSGGQSITISLSLQYRLPVDKQLGKIYKQFGSAYHERFILITRNTISNVIV